PIVALALFVAYGNGGISSAGPLEVASPPAITLGAADPTDSPLDPSAASTSGAPAASIERFVIAPGESKVAYQVGETFLNQNNRYNLAVGTTNAVSGEVLLDPTDLTRSEVGAIEVDISRLTSDSDRRDAAIRSRWLESSRYPVAQFTPTRIEGLPESYTPGADYPVQIMGDLKVRDTVRPTTFATTIRIDGDTLTASGATAIKMTDFGFD